MNVTIWGIGSSSYFGKQPDKTEPYLAWQAVLEALDDADVDNVDACYVGSVLGSPGVAQRCLQTAGITGVPVVRVENACASGTTAFHEAKWAIQNSRFERVLVLGIEHMTSKVRGVIPPNTSDPEGRAGLAMPGLYALTAARYLAAYSLRPEQLAMVAVKNLGNAMHNPRAGERGNYSINEVLSSKMIADPLTRLQCCSISDGASAAVLGPERANQRDVRIRSSALRSGRRWDHRADHVWGFEIVRDTARDAFDEAGISAHDANLFEVHDAFTIGEIVTSEALGLVEEGEGGRLVESGETRIGGRHPVNPSGGLLARGHPVGATGMAQIYEVVTQLRGEAGRRQIGGARIGVVETMGGGVSGIDGNACVVAVLEGTGGGGNGR